MQIRERIRLSGTSETEFEKHLEEELASYTFDLSRLLNSGLKFADNFNAQIVSFTSDGTANTEFSVAHTIKRVPTGIIIFHQDKAGSLYQGPVTGTAWTVSTLYLKCSVSSVTFKAMVF